MEEICISVYLYILIYIHGATVAPRVVTLPIKHAPVGNMTPIYAHTAAERAIPSHTHP